MTHRRPRPRAKASSGPLPVVLYAHPFELAFGLILLLSSIRAAGVLLPGVDPGPFDPRLADYVLAAYVVGGSIGGGAILIGLAGRAHALARAIEKAGLYLVAGVFLGYAVALINLDGFPGTITGLIQAVIAAACFLRAEAIRLTERIVLEQLRALSAGDRDATLIVDLVDGTHSPRRLGRRRRGR